MRWAGRARSWQQVNWALAISTCFLGRGGGAARRHLKTSDGEPTDFLLSPNLDNASDAFGLDEAEVGFNRITDKDEANDARPQGLQEHAGSNHGAKPIAMPEMEVTMRPTRLAPIANASEQPLLNSTAPSSAELQANSTGGKLNIGVHGLYSQLQVFAGQWRQAAEEVVDEAWRSRSRASSKEAGGRAPELGVHPKPEPKRPGGARAGLVILSFVVVLLMLPLVCCAACYLAAALCTRQRPARAPSQVPRFQLHPQGKKSAGSPEYVDFECPAGVGPGDKVEVPLPHGEVKQVVVPAGVHAGMKFSVDVSDKAWASKTHS